MRMDTRKPLVVMTPKSLLRHKLAMSSLDELAKGSFQHLIADTTSDPQKEKRVVLCSEIGRASCRDRGRKYVYISLVAGSIQKKTYSKPKKPHVRIKKKHN